eukprot:scaffold5956_cov385-Prasinococcus_capsulatus_cf.AAC.4
MRCAILTSTPWTSRRGRTLYESPTTSTRTYLSTPGSVLNRSFGISWKYPTNVLCFSYLRVPPQGLNNIYSSRRHPPVPPPRSSAATPCVKLLARLGLPLVRDGRLTCICLGIRTHQWWDRGRDLPLPSPLVRGLERVASSGHVESIVVEHQRQVLNGAAVTNLQLGRYHLLGNAGKDALGPCRRCSLRSLPDLETGWRPGRHAAGSQGPPRAQPCPQRQRRRAS